MVKRPRAKVAHQLTETELELMQILWQRAGGTVRDVLAALPPDRDLAYTSVSTILRILEQKGVVSAERAGQTHIYIPQLSRDEYERSALKRFVSTVFDQDPKALVARLIDGGDLSEGDLQRLRSLLDARLGR